MDIVAIQSGMNCRTKNQDKDGKNIAESLSLKVFKFLSRSGPNRISDSQWSVRGQAGFWSVDIHVQQLSFVMITQP